MSYIGVLHPSMIKVDLLKQHITYFDKLYVPALEHFLKAYDGTEDGDFLAREVEYLTGLGAIESIPLSVNEIDSILPKSGGLNYEQEKEFNGYVLKKSLSPLYVKPENINYGEYVKGGDFSIPGKYEGEISGTTHPIASSQYESIGSEILTRAYSARLSSEGVQATPLVKDLRINDSKVTNKSDVISVIIDEFPVPDDSVAFEDIFYFKEENTLLRNSLRRWMREMAVKEVTATELLEELEDIIADYKNELKRYKIKYRRQMLKSILLTPIEIAEGLLKINPSKSANAIFKISEEKERLLEMEKDIKGREIAYIVNANLAFNK